MSEYHYTEEIGGGFILSGNRVLAGHYSDGIYHQEPELTLISRLNTGWRYLRARTEARPWDTSQTFLFGLLSYTLTHPHL